MDYEPAEKRQGQDIFCGHRLAEGSSPLKSRRIQMQKQKNLRPFARAVTRLSARFLSKHK